MALTGLVASACQVEAASEEDQGSLEGDPGQIFSISAVQDFALAIDETDFAKMSAEMKIVEANRDFEHMLLPRTKGKGTFTYGTTTLPVEVKVKGMYSAQSFDHKPSLSIDFKGESFLGLKNLTLNAMTQDATMVHEMLAYRMYEAVAVPVPRIGYSRVSVNGQALGVYVTLEAIDKTFLTRKFGSDQGILYEGVYGGDVRKEDVGTSRLEHTSGKTNPQEDVDHAKLNELVAAVESRGEDLFFGDTALIETDSFLNMMAMMYAIRRRGAGASFRPASIRRSRPLSHLSNRTPASPSRFSSRNASRLRGARPPTTKRSSEPTRPSPRPTGRCPGP